MITEKCSNTYFSLCSKQMRSLATFNFFATIFFRFSTELWCSTVTEKEPPVVVLMFNVIGGWLSSVPHPRCWWISCELLPILSICVCICARWLVLCSAVCDRQFHPIVCPENETFLFWCVWRTQPPLNQTPFASFRRLSNKDDCELIVSMVRWNLNFFWPFSSEGIHRTMREWGSHLQQTQRCITHVALTTNGSVQTYTIFTDIQCAFNPSWLFFFDSLVCFADDATNRLWFQLCYLTRNCELYMSQVIDDLRFSCTLRPTGWYHFLLHTYSNFKYLFTVNSWRLWTSMVF